MKDLIDIILIGGVAHFEAKWLAGAIESLFTARATHPQPQPLPPPPPSWAGPYERLARAVGLPVDLSVGYVEAAAFFDPVLAGKVNGTWNPVRKRWEEGGP